MVHRYPVSTGGGYRLEGSDYGLMMLAVIMIFVVVGVIHMFGIW